ncbi:MAG TPA: alpha-mannosidase [Candidatus Acidoferrales bacterium]|nr:alpha-mannosidase [Candidatus Acidoferrales bacterium]
MKSSQRSAVLHYLSYLTLACIFVTSASSRIARAQQTATDWKTIVGQLNSITIIPLTDWKIHPADGGRWEAPDADDSNWPAYTAKTEWTTGSMWLRRWIELPERLNGYDIKGARLELRWSIGGESTVLLTAYVNGTQVGVGEDEGSLTIVPSAQPGGKILLVLKIQVLPGHSSLQRAQIELTPAPGRPDPKFLLDECEAAQNIIGAFPDQEAERSAFVQAALSAINWDALKTGDQGKFDDSLRAAQQRLEPLRPWLKTFTIHATGNTHIDMAWLWPRSETEEAVRSTFTSALELMQEYPNLTFTMSTAQAYAWIQEKYPDLFAQIQERVKEGRWEPIGGMWVEPDLNMPTGEAIVRQILLGKRYFQKNLGVDISVGWNPDSFGYNWQLPQIYKKSGINYFVTQKLHWNDTTHFPWDLFWWESPDGSKIITYFPHDYVNEIEPLKMSRDLADFETRDHYPVMMHLYGIGDHGGGPTRSMMDEAKPWADPNAIFPKIEFGKAKPYLEQVGADVAAGKVKLPTWDSELYLEFHRGVYTSQSETKKNNRRNETLLEESEKFSSLASLFGHKYPQAGFESSWQKLVFNEFHDILSGSGIHVVYVDATRDHEQIRRFGRDARRSALEELAAHANTEGAGVPVIVFNPLSWRRTDAVEAEVQFPRPVKNVEVLSAAGRQMLSEVTWSDATTNRLRVRFVAEGVPSIGYEVFHVVPVERAPHQASPLTANDFTLENEFVRVVVDPKTGCMTSLVDKTHKLDVLAPKACGNLLQTFVDKPKQWDAWNIDPDYEDHKWDLTRPEEVKLVENGPVRAVIRVVKKFQHSTFTQDITMYPHVPRVDVRMSADWHEQHIMLKVAFPIAAQSDSATFEIPYGTIERPTTRNTPEEKAKFEVPALRWGDLSDAKQGMSLLNDSKYGYDAKGNVLRLTLLRSPTWPDPVADQGFHTFTYSLYPHESTWRDADTMRQGYDLNAPLIAMAAMAHAGPLPGSYSFVSIEPENLAVTAIKKAEDDNGLILRFYEFGGKQANAKLHLPVGALQAWETNLMETPEKELPIRNGEIVLPTGPYSIQSVKVSFRKPEGTPTRITIK